MGSRLEARPPRVLCFESLTPFPQLPAVGMPGAPLTEATFDSWRANLAALRERLQLKPSELGKVITRFPILARIVRLLL